MGLFKDIGNAIVDGVKEEARNRKEMYDAYYEKAQYFDDHRLKEEYLRRRDKTDRSKRMLMEMKALRDLLRERGYGSETEQ